MRGAKDYFSFSKRERTGVIVLMAVIGVVYLVPEFINSHTTSMDTATVAEIRKQIASLKLLDPDSQAHSTKRNLEIDDEANDEPSNDYHQKTLVFKFDPNTLSEEGWKKLGIHDRTIQTIQKYISKGGQFRKAEDIGKIYGLHKDQYERLLPYVQIKNSITEKQQHIYEEKNQEPYPKTSNRVLSIIPLNTTDTTMLIELPGIGNKLANRIINFRTKLGGFYSVDQLKEIYGLPDSTFQKLKSFMQCDPSGIQQIPINTADAQSLKNHPYIKWNIANAIVNYREQHGNFKSVDDLLRIEIISPEILQKLSPYLRID